MLLRNTNCCHHYSWDEHLNAQADVQIKVGISYEGDKAVIDVNLPGGLRVVRGSGCALEEWAWSL